MMGDLLWRASLLFPDPRMGKAAAVLCAASAICAANGHDLAALAALAAVPVATFANQTGIKDLLIKDMIEDWWKKNEQERMNSKMTSAAESSMSSAD